MKLYKQVRIRLRLAANNESTIRINHEMKALKIGRRKYSVMRQ